ncbi:Triosephosphate isomerase [Candidatus Xenohaliotis californiensis]|uniref:Triosephosphate isomerase n=1 Tax=Candidatus Xenohaliotis californiensis TaxID=84677 RepID=A0ABP0EUS5_9RICK|nr:Triosephosphate isomerase [Candidatus Xenohaliotis californiensis]
MTKLIVANWKMNGGVSMINEYISVFVDYVNDSIKLIVCPPYPLLQQARKIFNNTIAVGAQNCSQQTYGAFTGEVSCSLLKEVGCDFVIVGHTERRVLFGENNQIIKNKIDIAIKHQIQPIVCIYKEDHSTDAKALNNIVNQCQELGLHNANDVIVAYEPKWAIGTNITPDINHVKVVLNTIRQATSLPTIYGGSVNMDNIGKLLDVSDGLLVGGMSTKPYVFYKAIKSACKNLGSN